MGYGDLFVAGLAGALLARNRKLQNRAALLVIVLAVAGDLAFFRVTEFPATVPVAVAVVVVEIWTRRGPPTAGAGEVPKAADRERGLSAGSGR